MNFLPHTHAPANYAAPVSAADEHPIDIHDLWARFRRRRLVFLAVLLVLASVVIAIVFTTPASYTATASVLVNEREPGLLRANPDGPVNSPPLDTARVDTQVEIIRSRTFADHVVEQFGLQKDPEFNAALRKRGPLSQIKQEILSRLPRAPFAASADPIDREGAPDVLLSHLKVTRVGVTYVLNLSVTASDPVKAKKLANAFADQYLASQIDSKVAANKALNNSLVPRLASLRSQVQEAETEVQQYRISNNLLTASGQTLTEQEIATLDQQLALARAQQVEMEARASTAYAQLKKGSTGEDVGEALNSPVIQQLRQQRALASQKVAELGTRYGDRLPAMVGARRDLADVDVQIHSEIERIISNLDAQAQVARQRANSIANSVARSKGSLIGNTRASVRLNELERNLESLRSLYENLLNRYKESSTEQGLEAAEAHIVTVAQTPGAPSAPKKGLGIVLGLMVGVVGGIIAVVLLEALDSTSSTASSLSRAVGLPCLASLPTVRSTLSKAAARSTPPDPLTYLQRDPHSSFAEAFRNLRASLLPTGPTRSRFVLAVTSALPNEGKSTTALCLGRTFANTGISVVIVDCDLKRKRTQHVSSWPPSTGLPDVLGGANHLDDSLVQDETSGAWMLPLAGGQLPQADIFSSGAMSALIDRLREQFDLVILDTPPVLAAADARTLASQADAALVLVRWRTTPLKAVENALALLAAAQVNIAGCALSFVDLRAQARTGYGDPEFYSPKYRPQYQT